MPTVRVTCPECEFTFAIADARVGGLITCRDCKAEFRVEFAEDEPPTEQDDRDDRPASKPKPRTRSRTDADHEPETWKTDLPLRSPVPLLLILVGLQVLVAGFLVLNWLVPVATPSASPTQSYYSSYPTAPKPTAATPSRKW